MRESDISIAVDDMPGYDVVHVEDPETGRYVVQRDATGHILFEPTDDWKSYGFNPCIMLAGAKGPEAAVLNGKLLGLGFSETC